MVNRLKEELIMTSAMGRASNRPVASYGQLDSKAGVSRPEGSLANKVLRDFTVKCMQTAGLSVRIDRVGNIFGRKDGSMNRKKAVMVGSHLDSVINGGHLDGALGVFAGIEAVRRLCDEDFQNQRPIDVVAFTGEEGSAFMVGAMLGSAFLTGKISADEALSTRNTHGRTLQDVLTENGYQGDFEYCSDDIDAFMELHIEQGPALDSENIPVGIVEHISGITWLTSIITGTGSHAGTTPMHLRQDALVVAADAVRFLNRRALEMSRAGLSPIVGTTGLLSVYPNNMNVIPAMVKLGFDIRSTSIDSMQCLADETISFLDGLTQEKGLSVHMESSDTQAPVKLSNEMVRTIEKAALRTGVRFKRMASGAGHDTQNMASIAKAGMIFVPSVKGISHSPMEWTEWDDIEKGVSVLTAALKDLSVCN